MHAVDRLPTVQAGVSSCRLGKGAQASAGPRVGPAGKNIGTAPLTWTLSEAAALGLRTTPAGQKSLARLAQQHAKGPALPSWAPQLARAG
jgi:hypothetical protein